LTKPDWIYYRYNVNQKMCGLHWEYSLSIDITVGQNKCYELANRCSTKMKTRANQDDAMNKKTEGTNVKGLKVRGENRKNRREK